MKNSGLVHQKTAHNFLKHHLIESWLDENFNEYKDDVLYTIYVYQDTIKTLFLIGHLKMMIMGITILQI